MKTLVMLLFVVILSVLAFQNCTAQWKLTTGPTGGAVSSITTNGVSVFAGTARGIFKSTDNGASWNCVTQMRPSSISSVAIIDTLVFAGSFVDGLYRSTDNGENWVSANKGLPYAKEITSIIQFANNLFVSVAMKGIFMSTNNGSSWTASNNGLNSIGSLQVYKLIVRYSDIYAATQSGIFRSTNYGASWDSVSNGIPEPQVFSIAACGNNLIASCLRGIFISEDEGAHWKPDSGAMDNKFVKSLEVYNNKVYAGTVSEGVYVSSDSGRTWDNINNKPEQAHVNTIAVNSNGIFIGTENRGIFNSTDYGANWKAVNNGFVASEITALLVDKTDVYAGTASGEIFHSSDNGDNWASVSNGFPNSGSSRVKALASCGGYLFASFDIWTTSSDSNSNGIYISRDKGASWKKLNAGSFSTLVNSFRVKGNELYAAAYHDGIFHTSNYGESWDTLNNGLTSKYITELLINGSEMYASSYDGLFVSTNNGAKWTKITNDLPPKDNVLALAAIDSNVFASYMSGTYLYRTTNKGLNWKLMGNGIQGIHTFAVYGKNLFASNGSFVFLSTDLGVSWKNVSNDPAIWGNRPLDLNDTYLFAGSSCSGVFVRKLTDMVTSIDDNENSLPESYSLKQNFPNPFNPTTTISYSIPKQSLVELKVHDMLGRELSTLVNKEQSAGEYKVQFNGASLPSGIYIYTIQAGQYRASKKLILLK